MGQKVNPIGLRLGIVKTWESRWYAGKNYSDYILEDYNIRQFLKKRLHHAGISRIVSVQLSDADWENRDVVIGFGQDEGVARLIELLINMSRAASSTNEVALEGEGGFRGVAPLSCEATFLLPGSFGWDGTLWPEEAAS